MNMFKAFILGLTGWRRSLAAFVAGLVSVLAMAPFFLFPILFITFAVLVWLVDTAVDRSATNRIMGTPEPRGGGWLQSRAVGAAGVGWWFGFGYFFAGLFWIGEAFLVEAEIFAWLLPFAVTLMPAGLALFWAGALATASFAWRPGFARILSLALSLSAFEWLRGHVLTGFPWNLPGYALTYPLPLMQSAGLLGVYTLTLIAIIIFAAPLVLWTQAGGGGSAANGSAIKGRIGAVAVAAVPLATLTIYGLVQLSRPDPPPVEGVRLRIVQPSVPQKEKWKAEHQARIFNDHLLLSRQSADGRRDDLSATTLLIWPEAAMPFLPLREPKALAAIAALLPKNTHLLSGALRIDKTSANQPRSQRQVFNSILVFAEDGRLAAHYDKTHLVPFGEYLPMKALLEAIGLRRLTQTLGNFDVGPTPRPLLRIAGLPALGGLICYEAIFPGIVANAAGRPGALINVTNDGWFGNTTGPRQHLHQSRVRAVEEGLALIRAANNGISAVIDPKGRIVHRLGMDQRGVIDADLPAAIAPPLYARFGDGMFFGLWLACLALLARLLYRFGL